MDSSLFPPTAKGIRPVRKYPCTSTTDCHVSPGSVS
jgi:hypothetical protein